MERKAGFVLYLAITSYVIQTVSSVHYNSSFQLESVKVGQPWIIECIDPSKSLKGLEWTKDGHEIRLNNFTTFAGSIGEHVLKSSSAELGDQGIYKCTNTTESIRMKVIDPLDNITDIRVWDGKIDESGFSLLCLNNNNKTQWFLDDKPRNITEGSKLTFQETSKHGIYACSNIGGDTIRRFQVVEVPKVRLPTSVSATEGEDVTIICAGVYQSKVKFRWDFGGNPYYESKDRVTLESDDKGHEGAVFKLSNVKINEGQQINCTAYYESDNVQVGTDSTLLRVKGKYAALWPFLGILAEVFILCAIILVYEKKRNKADLDESDTDQSPDTKPTPNKDSDVRHRK